MTDEYGERYVPTILQPLVERLATDDIAAVAAALSERFSTTETLEFFLDYVEEEGMIPPVRLNAIRQATASRRDTDSHRLAPSSGWEASKKLPVLFDGLSVFPRPPAPLAGVWFLTDHHDFGGGGRSGIGQLVYEAKTYEGKPGSPERAQELAIAMSAGASVAKTHGRFSLDRVDLVVPVPSFPEKVPFNLPTVLAEAIAQTLAAKFSETTLIKYAPTPPAKNTRPAMVRAAIPDAYRIDGGQHRGKVVLVVDDLIHNGTTLAGLADLLLEAGAKGVGAYVATRARVGMTQ